MALRAGSGQRRHSCLASQKTFWGRLVVSQFYGRFDRSSGVYGAPPSRSSRAARRLWQRRPAGLLGGPAGAGRRRAPGTVAPLAPVGPRRLLCKMPQAAMPAVPRNSVPAIEPVGGLAQRVPRRAVRRRAQATAGGAYGGGRAPPRAGIRARIDGFGECFSIGTGRFTLLSVWPGPRSRKNFVRTRTVALLKTRRDPRNYKPRLRPELPHCCDPPGCLSSPTTPKVAGGGTLAAEPKHRAPCRCRYPASTCTVRTSAHPRPHSTHLQPKPPLQCSQTRQIIYRPSLKSWRHAAPQSWPSRPRARWTHGAATPSITKFHRKIIFSGLQWLQVAQAHFNLR